MQLPQSQDAFLLGHLLQVNSSHHGWQSFMQAMLEHFNTRSFHLYVVNQQTQAMRFHVDAGATVSAEYMAIYVEKYVHEDRLMAAVNSRPLGHFYASNLLPAEVDVYGNEYYQKWALPQGVKEGAVARIYEDGDWTCYMACNRSPEQGLFTIEEIERLDSLIPFIEKSVKAAASLAENSKNELRAKALVNTFRFPAAVLTEYGELWAMNASMESFLQSESRLFVHEKTLKLEDKAQDKSFNLGILQTAKRAGGISMDLEHAERIVLREDTALGFHGLIENHEDQDTFLGVMVFVMNKDYYNELSHERLKSLFKLTQAEADICMLITQGLLPKQIASKKNKSVYTVREQLSKVFEKTGCSSQVALINLLSNIPR